MQWILEQIGWPWYSLGFNYFFGAVLFLPFKMGSDPICCRSSEEYLADRAHMLSQLLDRNLIDGTLIGPVREYETRLAA